MGGTSVQTTTRRDWVGPTTLCKPDKGCWHLHKSTNCVGPSPSHTVKVLRTLNVCWTSTPSADLPEVHHNGISPRPSMVMIITSREASQLLEHCTHAISSIQEDCKAALASDDSDPARGLGGCDDALIDLLARLAEYTAGLYTRSSSDDASIEEEDPAVPGRLDDVLSIAYAKFYAFLYKNLPACWRQLYTDASILKFCFLLHQARARAGTGWHSVEHSKEVKELVRVLDLALILAGAAGKQRGRQWIDKALGLLYDLSKEPAACVNASQEPPLKRLKMGTAANGSDNKSKTFSTYEPFTPPVRYPVDVVGNLSMEGFQARLDRPADRNLGPLPVIIRGAIESWPARSTRPWDQPDTLLSATFDGLRLVPVEIGRSYVDEGWGQKLVTFSEFVQDYIDPSVQCSRQCLETGEASTATAATATVTTAQSSREGDEDTTAKDKPKPKTGYLAQHPLFTQLPLLRNDILIPDYCYTAAPLHPTDPSMDQPELESPLLNAWFGPPGTITPLHTDPYHNILAQVVGRKYIRLYPPLETGRMRGRGRENGVEMGNTSLLDVGVLEGWDQLKESQGDGDDDGLGVPDLDRQSGEGVAAEFRDIPFVDCILEPGDVLYIPIGWWHYVRGLSVSFSVSFWWN